MTIHAKAVRSQVNRVAAAFSSDSALPTQTTSQWTAWAGVPGAVQIQSAQSGDLANFNQLVVRY